MRQGSANAAQEHAGVDIHSEVATADATLNALSTVFASFKYEARESIQPRTPDGYSRHWFGSLTIRLRVLIQFALIFCTVLLISGDRAYASSRQSNGLISTFLDYVNILVQYPLTTGHAGMPFHMTDNVLMNINSTTFGHSTVDSHMCWNSAEVWRWSLFASFWQLLHLIGMGVTGLLSVVCLAAAFIITSQATVFVSAAEVDISGVVADTLRLIVWRILLMESSACLQIHHPNHSEHVQMHQSEGPKIQSKVLVRGYSVLLILLACKVSGVLRRWGEAFLTYTFNQARAAKMMQVCLTEQRVVSIVCGGNVPTKDSETTQQQHDGYSLELKGLEVGHWQAIRFLLCFPDYCDAVAQRCGQGKPLQGAVGKSVEELKERAHGLAMIALRWLRECIRLRSEQGSHIPSVHTLRKMAKNSREGASRDEVNPGTSTQPEDGGGGNRGEDVPSGLLGSMTSSQHVSIETIASESRFTVLPSLAERTLHAIEASGTSYIYWAILLISKCTRIEAREILLESESGLRTLKPWFVIRFMKEHIRKTPYMEVDVELRIGDSCKKVISDPWCAIRLAYFMFFKVKSVSRHMSSIELTEEEVRQLERDANMRNLGLHNMSRLFDRDGDGSLSLPEFGDGMKHLYHTRKNLASGLLGGMEFMEQIGYAINGVLWFILSLIVVALFFPEQLGIAWKVLTTGVIAMAFIFGTSIREQYENALYIFVVKPFYPGDWIMIDGERYRVDRITLLSVEVMHMDGTAITFSTAEIRKKPIKNFTMSNKLREELQFSVAPTNPEEELRCITSTVKQCIQRHPKLYSGSCSVWWSHAEDSNLRLAISFDHRTNGVDASLRQLAKTFMYDAVVNVLLKLRIWRRPGESADCSEQTDAPPDCGSMVASCSKTSAVKHPPVT